MNYKEAKEKIVSILNDIHYAEENSEEYHPFDEKKIVQMMSEIRQEEEEGYFNLPYENTK